MSKFGLKEFLVFILMVLSFGVAQAQKQEVYGITLDEPLAFPLCDVAGKRPVEPYFPKEICYIIDKKASEDAVALFGSLMRGKVYFPKGKVPQGFSQNYLLVILHEGMAVEVTGTTKGLSDQEAVFERLKAMFGKPKVYEVAKAGENPGVKAGAITAIWESGGLLVRFYGSAGESGEGSVNFAALPSTRSQPDVAPARPGAVSLGKAGSRAVYGIAFDQPLTLPRCKKDGKHFPQEVCAVVGKTEKLNFGSFTDVDVYFPEDKVPAGFLRNSLRLLLLNGDVYVMFAATQGLDVQEELFQELAVRFSDPDILILADRDDKGLATGSLQARWRTEGLKVELQGCLKSKVGGLLIFQSSE